MDVNEAHRDSATGRGDEVVAWDGAAARQVAPCGTASTPPNQARRGTEAYEQACTECHGADLSSGDMASKLAGVGFVYNWHGFPASDLFERLRVLMPPAQLNRVSQQEKAEHRIGADTLRRHGAPGENAADAAAPQNVALVVHDGEVGRGGGAGRFADPDVEQPDTERAGLAGQPAAAVDADSGD